MVIKNTGVDCINRHRRPARFQHHEISGLDLSQGSAPLPSGSKDVTSVGFGKLLALRSHFPAKIHQVGTMQIRRLTILDYQPYASLQSREKACMAFKGTQGPEYSEDILSEKPPGIIHWSNPFGMAVRPQPPVRPPRPGDFGRDLREYFLPPRRHLALQGPIDRALTNRKYLCRLRCPRPFASLQGLSRITGR